MANILDIFLLQLLYAFFTPCLLHITSSDIISVHPGENITLLCTITDYPEISWYQLRSDEVKLLISAKKIVITFSLCYNVNKSHFDATESNSSVSLVIIGVQETDLGFYYCGGRNDDRDIQFGKLIRLNFPDGQHNVDNVYTVSSVTTVSPSHPPAPVHSTQLWMSVCVVSVLMNLICMCAFCGFYYRCKGKSVSLYSCCSNTRDATKKVEEESMHYASIQHGGRPRAAAKKNTATDPDSVTYAAVASQHPRRC